jgi:hypothetical protein
MMTAFGFVAAITIFFGLWWDRPIRAKLGSGDAGAP